MDTWWKKTMYSKWLKGISVIGILVTGFILFISFIGVCTTSPNSNYYESYQMERDFMKKAGYVRDWIVRYDEASIFDKVTPEEIAEYKNNSSENLSDEAARAGIITDRKSYYALIQNELVTKNKNFEYLAIDNRTNRIVTNMEMTNTSEMIKELTSRTSYLEGNGYCILNYKVGSYISTNDGSYLSHENYYIGRTFEGQNDYHIYAALKEPLEAGDSFYTDYMNFQVNKLGRDVLIKLSMILAVIATILLIYYLAVVGRSERKGKIKLNAFDRISMEVQIILSLLGIVLGVGSIEQLAYHTNLSSAITFTTSGIQYQLMAIAGLGVISMTVMAFELLCLSSWVKHLKNKSMLEHLGIYSLMKKFYYSKESKGKLLAAVGLMVAINIVVEILMIVTTDLIWSNFYLIIRPVLWSLLLGTGLLKIISDYQKVLEGAKEISEGHLDKKIELKKSLPMLQELSATINSMGTGLEKAVGESIKSERLKTELITNVSHDLKTPLTSIISYIDLLKGEEIENERAKEYIDILDERSHRLKHLVEDLVEASKAVTGNVKAEVETLSLDQLVAQAAGEYMDRMEEGHLNLMMEQLQETWVSADGRHMWRIIENLLSNVCKYAMPQTRVYIDVYQDEHYGYCRIRNISKDPLNIEPDELTERFVRGDSSRTTEGSGLGLAIAKSLAVLQKGDMEINIDGDLFKVIVKVPIMKREKLSLDKDKVV